MGFLEKLCSSSWGSGARAAWSLNFPSGALAPMQAEKVGPTCKVQGWVPIMETKTNRSSSCVVIGQAMSTPESRSKQPGIAKSSNGSSR